MIQNLPQNKLKVFDGKNIEIIDRTDDLIVGRLVVLSEIIMKGKSMDIPKEVRTNLHFDDYFAFLALAKNAQPIIGNSIEVFTVMHPKDVVSVNIEKLIKHFPDKKGSELSASVGLITNYDADTKLYSVMILNTTLELKREDLIHTNNKNVKYIYCLNTQSKQVGLDIYTNALNSFVEEKKTAKKKTKIVKEESEPETSNN